MDPVNTDGVSPYARLESGTPMPDNADGFTPESRAELERIGVLHPDRSVADYKSYSVEQLIALDAMKDRAFEAGIAKPEFVNHVVWPDASVDTDPASLIETVRALRNAIEAGTAPEWAGTDATGYTRLLKDIADHAAEQRFVFFVSSYDHPHFWLVYFQCATESNPELPARVASVEG